MTPAADAKLPRAQAEHVLAAMRSTDAHNASAETVGALQRVVDSLDPDADAPPWREATALLASHLLECPQGARASNVERAQTAYRRILAQVERIRDADAWLTASVGLANALFIHPAATPAVLDEAAALYREAIAACRDGEAQTLALVLGNFASLLSAQKTGDIDSALEEAITCQTEAAHLLDALAQPAQRSQRARAHYNLGRLYLQRRTGLRANNVDRAVRELRAALAERPEQSDPVGRVRTLRGLTAAYPEWSGADSLAAAQQLADAAQAEADAIEARNATAAQRNTGWAAIARQASALDADLDVLYQMPEQDRRPWLMQHLATHDKIVRQLSPEAPPALRAHWLGGMARLLGRLPSLGQWTALEAVHQLFEQGLAAARDSEQPRVVLSVCRRWGEFAHEIGDFERAFAAYREAAELGNAVFDDFADPEHRAKELETMRGDALFAAYAAACTGRAAQAVQLAELSRNRLLADALLAARVAAELTDQDARKRLITALREVQTTEDALRRARERSPEHEMETAIARLAAAVGVDRAMLKARRTDANKDAPDPTAEEQARLRQDLQQAYTALRALLMQLGGRHMDGAAALDAETVCAVAHSIGNALVYLMTTIHGSAALAALPDGRTEILLLDGLDSATARPLAHQLIDTDATLLGEDEASARLDDALQDIEDALRTPVFAPLEAWLAQLGAGECCLIPLGSMGILPLQVAAGDESGLRHLGSNPSPLPHSPLPHVAFSLAPSAAALAVAGTRRAADQATGAIVLADPLRPGVPALPFARAEARWIAHLLRQRGVTVELHVGAAATLAHLLEHTAPVAWLHLACHGSFATADPLQSALLLAGDDTLQLADLLAARTTIGGARIATLSACFSAQAERRSLPDETLGFPLALMLAGVSGVIGTAWAVHDAAAMLFNARLYALLLDGTAPAHAVVQARAWLREADAKTLAATTVRIRATLHDDDRDADAQLDALYRYFKAADPAKPPFGAARYWAAFTLTGA